MLLSVVHNASLSPFILLGVCCKSNLMRLCALHFGCAGGPFFRYSKTNHTTVL